MIRLSLTSYQSVSNNYKKTMKGFVLAGGPDIHLKISLLTSCL